MRGMNVGVEVDVKMPRFPSSKSLSFQFLDTATLSASFLYGLF